MDERITRAIIGAVREHDRSGHEIWDWLGPTHGEQSELTEANLYPTLYRLEAERIIRGDWRDGKPTRRLYRVAARGVDLATERGWPVLAKLGSEPRRAPSLARSGGDGDSAEFALDAPAAEEASTRAGAAIKDYVSQLDAGLRLSEAQRNLVRIEIADHLEDCTQELADQGMDSGSAAAEAIDRLGPPEALAEAISVSQLTRWRLLGGLRVGGYQALIGAALGLAAGATFVLLAPLAGRWLTALASSFGVHLYIPETSEWRAQQTMAAGWVGAFLAARRSTRRVALQTRRAESAVRPVWASMGVVALTFAALLLPVTLDLLSAVGLIGLPVAFVIGTWQAQGQGDDPISRRGVAWATLVLAAFLFAPGFRIWLFDASAGTPNTPPAATSTVRLDWENNLVGTLRWNVYVTGLDSGTWHDPRVEFWPARREGVAISPDVRATGPLASITPGEAMDLARLQTASPDSWVTVTAVGTDGQRRALYAEVHLAATNASPQNLIGWVLQGG